MIEIPRALARQFRAVLRRSMMEGRSDWPLVLFRTDEGGLTLEARQGDAAVRFQHDGKCEPVSVAFRASVLAEFEGRSDEPVTIEQVTFGKGRARWTDDTVPRVIEFETVTPESVPPFPETPKRFTALPAPFLQAFDEAARTTARESGRLSLSRVQLRGRNGEVVATDGRQLLVQGGFPFPWSDDVLVPRVLAFGGRELAADDEPIGIGRTETHIALRVGAWTFLLAIDTHSRFPDAQAVIPKPSRTGSCLHLDPDDAAFLTITLPRLPGREEQHVPVTLDLGSPPAVRAQAEGAGQPTEVVLVRSSCSGPAVRVSTDRRLLLRSLKLGFIEVQVFKPDLPLLCRDDRRTYVWMALDKETVIPPSPASLPIRSAEDKIITDSTLTERRAAAMPAPTRRNHVSDNGSHTESSADRGASPDLIEDAEALRALLQEASARSARLIAALKHQRRQSRAVQQAMASLRQLQIDR